MPELTRLLNTKSMIRYPLTKESAGFACMAVNGYRRRPSPPARTKARILFMDAEPLSTAANVRTALRWQAGGRAHTGKLLPFSYAAWKRRTVRFNQLATRSRDVRLRLRHGSPTPTSH